MNHGKKGRPKKDTTRIRLTLSKDICDYIHEYRKQIGRDYAGSEHVEELLRIGLAIHHLLPLLLADRSPKEVEFILTQIPFTSNIEWLIEF